MDLAVVDLSLLCILIKPATEHLVIWKFPLFHTFASARVQPPLSTLKLEDNLLSWWAPGITWPIFSPHYFQ